MVLEKKHEKLMKQSILLNVILKSRWRFNLKIIKEKVLKNKDFVNISLTLDLNNNTEFGKVYLLINCRDEHLLTSFLFYENGIAQECNITWDNFSSEIHRIRRVEAFKLVRKVITLKKIKTSLAVTHILLDQGLSLFKDYYLIKDVKKMFRYIQANFEQNRMFHLLALGTMFPRDITTTRGKAMMKAWSKIINNPMTHINYKTKFDLAHYKYTYNMRPVGGGRPSFEDFCEEIKDFTTDDIIQMLEEQYDMILPSWKFNIKTDWRKKLYEITQKIDITKFK